MPLEKPRRSGPRRLPPPVLPAARRCAAGSAVVAVPLALLAPGASAVVPAEPAGDQAPADEFARLQFEGRAQPEVATVELLRYADALHEDDPRWLEALLEPGSEYVGLNRGEQVEQLAARMEALSDHVPLARPAAMLLRGQWMQTHGDRAATSDT